MQFSSSSSANVGSYVLSTEERVRSAGAGPADVNAVASQALKLIGRAEAISIGALQSSTGVSADLMQAAIHRLKQDQLVQGSDDRLSLTPLGQKAHSIVAT
uniref:hypothetical protein n=1 Tax=Bradyrhizobium sp. (strain ORS 278) TaxID=114615 RepID=UPI0002FB9D6C|nr:hypothetical protein [Bradyrhizobium sp. ORS 278]